VDADGHKMPPTDEFIRDALTDLRSRLIRMETKLDGYNTTRCEAHTDRLEALASRMDTADAARRALAEQHNARWSRLAQSVGIMAAVAALVTLGLRLVGL
jgi:hypothetical protein